MYMHYYWLLHQCKANASFTFSLIFILFCLGEIQY
uniref:Uncharacterized protein n=1 Tax=Rhizophora mucronata TaxID=61149 RepID=A0A2P2PY49_RHIMU